MLEYITTDSLNRNKHTINELKNDNKAQMTNYMKVYDTLNMIYCSIQA